MMDVVPSAVGTPWLYGTRSYVFMIMFSVMKYLVRYLWYPIWYLMGLDRYLILVIRKG